MKSILYYDIGLNLFCRQFKDPETILTDAWNEGVCCIITGSDMKSNEATHRFVQNHNAYGTAGIHPHNADSARKEDFVRIEQMLTTNPKLVAVGECGLDFDRMYSTRENQIRCLHHHIAIAEKLGKPMFLHERAASKDFAAIFQKHPDLCRRSVVHCFTGDKATVETYLDMGFSIGITGWICDDRRAGDLRQAVPSIPLDRLLIETDAPYLTPRNVPGLARTNLPQNVRYVARELAKYRHVSEAELMTCTRRNTERLFGLPSLSPAS
ncbi:MAG: TatD family hydrolase [Clostridia bacterium]|nr:TatD family hydrolase [Clostridia bacterium]